MFKGISKWWKETPISTKMNWIGRGCAMIAPAVVGLVIYDMGRSQGALEEDEKQLKFLNGLIEKLEVSEVTSEPE